VEVTHEEVVGIQQPETKHGEDNLGGEAATINKVPVE